jgi:hypothetical protein
MTNGSWIASSALLGLLATSAAQADLITIDADVYAPGTDVSNVFDGVSLAHLTFTSAGMQSTAVYAAGCADVSNPNSACSAIGPASFGYQASTGSINGFWYSTGSPIINCVNQNYSYCYNSTPQHLLEVSFDSATGLVQFESTYGSDFPWVWALDAAGNVLSLTPQQTIHQNPGPGGGPFGYQTVTLSSTTANISRVIIAGNGGYVRVDGITYDGISTAASVPEPETLGLLLAGLVGAVVTTRRRKPGTPAI